MNNAISSASPRSATKPTSEAVSSDAFPTGLTLILVMIVALAVIIGFVFYLAGQMPV